MIDVIKNKVEKLEELYKDERVKQIIDVLNSVIDKNEEITKFVKQYQPFPANKSMIDEYIKKHKIKVKKKRKFGVISIAKLLKEGGDARNAWMNYNSMIDNTLWLSVNFDKNTEEQKVIKLSHEINHHILSQKIGVVRYDAAYLASQWFRLAIELSAYKVNYEHSDSKDLYISQLATKFIKDYDIKMKYEDLTKLITSCYT